MGIILVAFGLVGCVLFGARNVLSPTTIPEQEEHRITLIAVGDVMLSRAVAERMRAHGADYPFSGTRDILREGDIVFGNLETPIVEGRAISYGEMTFRADTEAAGALARAGFTIVSLANNHTTNFGPDGLRATFRHLSDAGIAYAGAGNNRAEAYAPAYVERNGTTFAFLAYTYAPDTYGWGSDPDMPGLAGLDIGRMTTAVREAKEHADIVVVSMHAGDEYATDPNETQRTFARAAIDAGALLVVGHHPHVLQPFERYNGGLILYSLGNFVFDQVIPETQQSVIARIVFTENDIEDVSFIPVSINDLSRPVVVSNEEGKSIIERIVGTTE